MTMVGPDSVVVQSGSHDIIERLTRGTRQELRRSYVSIMSTVFSRIILHSV